jgi:hypothetical protein
MATTKTGRDRAPRWCGIWLVEQVPWQGNKNYCCNAPKKIYLTKICGTYIETGALSAIDNQIVRTWAGVFSSKYDRVSRNFMTTVHASNFKTLSTSSVFYT